MSSVASAAAVPARPKWVLQRNEINFMSISFLLRYTYARKPG